ncbi:unnamed protein product, partial [Phaeothamnion confervicola]
GGGGPTAPQYGPPGTEVPCYCGGPTSPLSVECYNCSRWYCMCCLGMSKEQCDAIDDYACVLCQAEGCQIIMGNRDGAVSAAAAAAPAAGADGGGAWSGGSWPPTAGPPGDHPDRMLPSPGSAPPSAPRRSPAGPKPASRDWLHFIEEMPDSLYAPQPGDAVWYFPAGHKAFLDAHPAPPEQVPVWLQGGTLVDAAGIACKVETVGYQLPPAPPAGVGGSPGRVQAVVMLRPEVGGVFGGAGAPAAPFSVTFWPSESAADFVVLRTRVARAMLQAYEVDDVVTMRFTGQKKLHEGTIVQVRDALIAAAGMPPPGQAAGGTAALPPVWEGLMVRWKESYQVGAVNVWQVERPKRLLSTVRRRRQERGLPPVPPEGAAVAAAAGDDPNADRPTVAQQVAAGMALEDLLDSEEALCRMFAEEVTDAIAPGYSREVPLPMHLQLVLERLRRKYYRSGAAALADIELVNTNAALYNGPTSEVAMQARKATDAAAHSIRGVLGMRGGAGRG